MSDELKSNATEPMAEAAPAEAALPTPAELDELRAKAAKADEHWDRLLRQAADFENFKKRAARDRQDALRYANEGLLAKLVPVLDNFEMAMAAANGAQPAADPAAVSLDTRVQDLKGDIIRLNRDLMVLEEELLFPASTQVAVFVSLDVGTFFALDSVQIKLDDKVVANYLYTPAEVKALHRGGVQRIYVGNLRAGQHEIVAFFTGGGTHERDYRRGTTIKFDKGTDPKYIELQIKDSTAKLQPEFEVKVWQ